MNIFKSKNHRVLPQNSPSSGSEGNVWCDDFGGVEAGRPATLPTQPIPNSFSKTFGKIIKIALSISVFNGLNFLIPAFGAIVAGQSGLELDILAAASTSRSIVNMPWFFLYGYTTGIQSMCFDVSALSYQPL